MARRPLSILDFYSAELPFATEFRRLLHRIKKSNGESELKSLLITSAMLSEGKSTICSFLAVTAARQKGMKALLIDADLRRPSIHRYFAISRENGLSEILVDDYNPIDMIKNTEMENLHILTAGKRVPSPADPSANRDGDPRPGLRRPSSERPAGRPGRRARRRGLARRWGRPGGCAG